MPHIMPQEIEREVLDKIEMLTALIIPQEENRHCKLSSEILILAMIKCYCDGLIMQDKKINTFLSSEDILDWIATVHSRSVEDADRVAQAYAVTCLQKFIQHGGIEMPLMHIESPSRFAC